MIQQMLAIWSLVSLPFLHPAWTSGSSRFTYGWSLVCRILSITLLACKIIFSVYPLGGTWHAWWKWKSLSRVQLCATPIDYSPQNFPGQNTGVVSLSLLQGTFPTQGLNPGLQHCRWFFSSWAHKGSWRILEWVAYPFSRRSSSPGNQSEVSCIAGGFSPTELPGKPFSICKGVRENFRILCSLEQLNYSFPF